MRPFSIGLALLIAAVCAHAQTTSPSKDTVKPVEKTVVADLNADERLKQAVTFSFNGGPMREMLAKLSEQTGLSFSADRTVQEDLIVLRVTEQSLNAVMKKVAEHFHFEWERAGEAPNYRYKLFQGLKEIQKEKALHEKDKYEQVEKLKQRLKAQEEIFKSAKGVSEEQCLKWLEEADQTGDLDKKKALYQKAMVSLMAFDPIHTPVFQLVSSLTSQQWDRLLEKQQLMFSTRPVTGEAALPDSVLTYAQQQADMEIEYQRKSIEEENKKHLSNGEALETAELPTVQKVAALKMRLFLVQDGLIVEYLAFDEASKPLDSVDFYAIWGSERRYVVITWRLQNHDQRITDLKSKIRFQIPEETKRKEFATLKTKDYSGDPIRSRKFTLPKSLHLPFNLAKPAEEYQFYSDSFVYERKTLYETLESLQTQDPLERVYTPLLEEIQKAGGINVISDGFDGYLSVLEKALFDPLSGNWLLGASNVGQLLDGMAYGLGQTVELNEGWASFRSKRYYSKRLEQVSRGELRRWAKTLQTQSYFSLDDVSQMAATLTDEQADANENLLHRFVDAVFETYIYSPFSLPDRLYLRLYASLSSQQKQAALSETGVSLDSLSAAQQSLYKQILMRKEEGEDRERDPLRSLEDPIQLDPKALTFQAVSNAEEVYLLSVNIDGKPTFWHRAIERNYFEQDQEGIIDDYFGDLKAYGGQLKINDAQQVSYTLMLAPNTPYERSVTYSYKQATSPVKP